MQAEEGAAPSTASALRKPAALIGAFVLVAIAVAGLYLLVADKRYQARAKILVTPVPNDEAFTGFSLLRESEGGPRAAETAARLVKTQQIADAVAIRLGDASGSELLDAVEAEPVGRSNIVEVEAEASEGARAAQIANGFADELVARRSARFQTELAARLTRLRTQLTQIPAARRREARAVSLERQLSRLAPLVGSRDPTLLVVSDAVAPSDPSTPSPWLLIGLAAAAGLVLALTLLALPALARRRSWRRSTTAEGVSIERFAGELERRLGSRLDALAAQRTPVPPAPAADDGARKQRERDLEERSKQRERDLDERSKQHQREVDERAKGLERQAKELAERGRALGNREQEVSEHERQLSEVQQRLEERIAAVTQREAALARRAAELAARPVPAPEEPVAAPPAPTAPATSRIAGTWNLNQLERLVSEHEEESPDRRDEWTSYLFVLRGHAAADGSLPRSFDYLVEQVFGDLLQERSGGSPA